MKLGWVTYQLKDIAAIYNGNSISKADKTEIYSSDQKGRNFIATKDVNFDDSINYSTEIVVPESHKDLFKIAHEGSTLICAEGGSAGRKVGYLKQSVFFGNKLYAVRPKKNIASKYIYFFCKSDEFKEQFKARMTGLIGGVSKKKFESIEIPVPKLSEQQKIVDALNLAFEKIESLEKVTVKKIELVKNFYTSVVEKTFDELLDVSKYCNLIDVCDERGITYGVIKLGEHFENGVPCLRTSNVKALKIDATGAKKIESKLSLDYSRTILKGDEVLVNVRGTLGGVCVVPNKMIGWNISREVAMVPVDAAIVKPHYIAFFISSLRAQQWLTGVLKGAAYKGINLIDLRKLKIPMVDENRQNQTVKKLQANLDKVTAILEIHESKLKELRELRQSILKKAFSGKLVDMAGSVASLTAKVIPTNDNYAHHAGAIAYADSYFRNNAPDTFHGRTIFEKVVQAAEVIAGIELGRQAVQGMRGPTDDAQREAVEAMASEKGYFSFESTGGKGMKLQRGRNFNELRLSFEKKFQSKIPTLDKFLRLIAPMPTRDVEVLSTVHTAWNNYLIEKQEPTDEQIVHAACEGWHEEKTKIPRHKFFTAIETLRKQDLVPTGQGKYVGKIAGQSFDF